MVHPFFKSLSDCNVLFLLSWLLSRISVGLIANLWEDKKAAAKVKESVDLLTRFNSWVDCVVVLVVGVTVGLSVVVGVAVTVGV